MPIVFSYSKLCDAFFCSRFESSSWAISKVSINGPTVFLKCLLEYGSDTCFFPSQNWCRHQAMILRQARAVEYVSSCCDLIGICISCISQTPGPKVCSIYQHLGIVQGVNV